MLNLDKNLNLSYNNEIILHLELKNKVLKGTLISNNANILVEEFHSFYKEYILKYSNTIQIQKEFFSNEEVDFLESIGFFFYQSSFDYQKDTFMNSYKYIYKEKYTINKEIMKDIMEKMDF